MPVLPPIPNAPYDTLNTVMNTARTRLNDVLDTTVATGGTMLQDTAAFSRTVANTSWRKMQSFLGNLGYTVLNKEVQITALPAVATTDPSVETSLNWFNFFDGLNYWDAPVLPPDFVMPLWVKERVSGQAAAFVPMECMLDGLPDCQKGGCNLHWEWRENAIWMPGSQMVMDLKIKYGSFLPDFEDSGDLPWYMQPVFIMRCLDSFAWYICAEYVGSRGEEALSATFTVKAENAAKLIINRDVRLKQRVNVRRQPRSGGRGSGFCY